MTTTPRYTLLPSHPSNSSSTSDSNQSSEEHLSPSYPTPSNYRRMDRSIPYHDHDDQHEDDDDHDTLRPRSGDLTSPIRHSHRQPHEGDNDSDGIESDEVSMEDDELDLENAHAGVKKVEAAKKVYSHGRYSKIILFISLGLASYIYALDSSTTSVYLTYAASTFGEHSKISSIQVVQSIIIAVGKPIIAKIADVTSRATAYLVVLIFYVVGYTAIATAQSVSAIGSGIVVYAVGYTGLHLLTQILIADITTLAYRGLVSSLTTLPFIVNGFIGPKITVWVLEHWNQEGEAWRWGYAMFAILLPLCLSPLIIILFWAERKARKIEKKNRVHFSPSVLGHLHSHSRSHSRMVREPLIRNRSRSRSSSSISISPSISSPPNTPFPSHHHRHHHQHHQITQQPSLKHHTRLYIKTIIRKVIHEIAHFSSQLDLFGLILLGVGVGMILLPLTLSRKVAEMEEALPGTGEDGAGALGAIVGVNASSSPTLLLSILLPLGTLILIIFTIYDLRYASKPVIALRFVKNRSVVCACIVGFFDFASFFLTFIYLYTFVLVVKPWSSLTATYFMQIQTVALTIFGFTAGISMWWFRRYKYVLIGGLCIRLVGVALMIHSRGANASTFELISTQILQGMGGGFAAASSQVGAQASVPHADVAIVTALVLLVTEIGGAVGGGLAGGIWTKSMPQKLKEYLPQLNDTQRAKLFGDIVSVTDLPRDDAVRLGVMKAYDDTMKTMVIIATIMSVIPILSSLFMPNWYLGDTQNAVEDDLDEDGEAEDMLIGGSRESRRSSSDDNDEEGAVEISNHQAHRHVEA